MNVLWFSAFWFLSWLIFEKWLGPWTGFGKVSVLKNSYHGGKRALLID